MAVGGSSEAPLDLCIVGAGIAGSVAALRAQELGLSFALLEADKPLHRQRAIADIDRADTVILDDVPGTSSPWIADARLAAGSQAGIAGWIARLSQREIPLEVGARVFSIEREGDDPAVEPADPPGGEAGGAFCLRISERSSGREHRLRARAVILATGAPEDDTVVPRRPGAATPDPALVIGAATLVVGNGRDAIEQVIAIALAKAAAKDPHPVYWSPGFADMGDATPGSHDFDAGTGDRLLATVVAHGNIRTQAPLVSLREQTQIDGHARILAEFATPERAGESGRGQPVDFDARCVVRCDVAAPGEGADTNEDPRGGWPLLSGLAVRIERRDASSFPIVDRRGALSLDGLFLIGDACGDTRLVCEDFSIDPGRAEYERETRDPSIESAAREAVAAVEAIAGYDASAAVAVPSWPTDSPSDVSHGQASPVDERPAARWQLVAIEADGSLGAATPITAEVFEIGRRARDLTEPDDEHMADHHASLVFEDGEYFIADSGRGSGVWVRIDEREGALIEDEDQIWLGSQILVASREGDAWTLVHYGPDGRARDTHAVTQREFTVGRDADINLTRDDGLLSRKHARFSVEGEFLKAFDCGARNGTFVKVSGAHALADGAEFRIATRGYRFQQIDPAAGA